VSTWAAGVDRRNHLNNAAPGLARSPTFTLPGAERGDERAVGEVGGAALLSHGADGGDLGGDFRRDVQPGAEALGLGLGVVDRVAPVGDQRIHGSSSSPVDRW